MEYTTLDKICENLDSQRKPITSSDRVEGSIPYYGASGVVDYVQDYIFDERLLLVSEDGANLLARSTPIAFSIEGKTWVNNHAHVLRFADNIKQKYMELYLNSISLEPYITGSAQPKLNQKMLNEIPIPVVDRETMKMVVDAAEQVNQIISIRKKELEELDNLIKARFVELFGDPLASNKVNYIFTECVEFNPKKLEVKDLQDVEVSFVPMECVGVDGSFSIKGIGLVSDYYNGYTYFRDGDVLLAKITPCFENGKVAIATDCKNGIGFGTTEFHVSRPLKGITNSVWIKYLLKNDMVHDLATINMSGSAGQKRIQTPFFNKLKVYVPPIEQQEEFADFVKQVDKSKFRKLCYNSFERKNN